MGTRAHFSLPALDIKATRYLFSCATDKMRTFVIFLCLALSMTLTAYTQQGSPLDSPRPVAVNDSPSNRIIVQFGTVTFSINDTFGEAPAVEGASLIPGGFLRNLGLVLYEIDANETLTPQQFCDELLEDPEVTMCEPDQNIKLDQAITPVATLTNDALSSEQWGLQAVNVDQVWTQGITGTRQVRVCVMDSGIDLLHPDLQQNIWINPGEIPNNGVDDDGNGVVDDVNGASFIRGVTGNKVQDQNGHGLVPLECCPLAKSA